MMKLGLGTYACAWSIGVPGHEAPETPLDAFGFLRLADALGLKVTQYADNLPLHFLNVAAQKRLAEEANDLGMDIEVGTRGVRQEQLLLYLDIACRFHSPILRVVVDSAGHEPSPEEVLDALGTVIPAFQAAEVAIVIENHDRFTAQVLVGILDQLRSPFVGICLDTVNSFAALEGPKVVVETLAPYVLNLHVKDFIIQRAEHNMGFAIEGCPAGTGQLDLPWLFETLASNDRDCNAILEQWPAPEENMAETVAKEHRWIEESVRYLRTLIKD